MPWISGNYFLGQSDMENNALLVAQYGYAHGWTKNAISAILGNMQAESTINPGIWESLTTNPDEFYRQNGRYPGYGLVQWTPFQKYRDWAISAGYSQWENNGDAELSRISYEAQNNIQWFSNAQLGIDPPITFQEFLVSTRSVNDLSNYWLWFYEHPVDPYAGTQAYRQGLSNAWYNFLPDGPSTGFPIWLLFKFNDWRRLK